MNAPIKFAQAGTQQSAEKVTVIILEKPDSGQAITVKTGYEGKVKLDFSKIADERITIVRVGETAVIFFHDNKSTITLDPFFGSGNLPLANLEFDLGGNRIFTAEQIAGILPFTVYQGILPAAGDGASGNEQDSGANFNPANVEDLPPILLNELLPPEELPGIEFAIFDGALVDDEESAPPTIFSLSLSVEDGEVDEDALPDGIAGGPPGNGDLPPPDLFEFTKSINVDWDGDTGAGRNIFFTSATPVVKDEAGNDITDSLKSGGQQVHFALLNDQLLVGYIGDAVLDLPTDKTDANVVFYVEVDLTNIDAPTYFFKIILPLDHPFTDPDLQNDGPETAYEDDIVFTFSITAENSQGATETATFDVLVDDDSPLAPEIELSGVNVVHDETPGLQQGANAPNGVDDSDGDDVAGNTLPPDVLDLFNAIVNKGNDPHVDPAQKDNGAIGFARSDGALVNIVGAPQFGADGPATAGDISYSLLIVDGTFSGVQTTEGTDIFLYTGTGAEVGLILGRVGNENDPDPDTANPAGAVAFAIYIDPDTGEVFVAQYLSLFHTDSPDNHDEPESLANGAIQLVVTLTDNDGDKTSSTIDIGEQILFEDDGPAVDVSLNTQFDPMTHLALELDETVQPDGGSDPTFDRYNTGESESPPSPSNGGADDVESAPDVYNRVPVIELDPDAADAIGSLQTASGALQQIFQPVNANFGADGPGPNGGLTQQLTLVLSSSVVATNLIATALVGTALESLTEAERTIHLHQVDDYTLEGRIAGVDGPGGATTDDEYVVFRITLVNPDDPANAYIQVDHFIPIDHGGTEDPSVFDENIVMTLAQGATLGLTLEVTATDGDFDTVTESATAIIASADTSFLSFDDDGPDITGVTISTGQIIHDETAGVQNDPADPDAPHDFDEEHDVAVQPAVFDDAFDVGGVLNGLTALGYAQNDFALTIPAGAFGTDGPAATDPVKVELVGSGGGAITDGTPTSLLDTFSGNRIFLKTDPATGLLLGVVGLGTGGSADYDPNGEIVFAIAIEVIESGGNWSYVVSIAQIRPILHPDTDDNDELEVLQILNREGTEEFDVFIKLTLTDGDGDFTVILSEEPIQIGFDDDGPTAPTLELSGVNVVHDETPGLQQGANAPNGVDDSDGDDVAGNTLPQDVLDLFNAIVNKGDDPHVTAKDNDAIGFARSGASLVNVVAADFGADGPWNGSVDDATTYEIQVVDGTFSGVQTTEGTDVFLYTGTGAEAGLILGRVGNENDPDPDTANPNGVVAFAIYIDPDSGEVFVAHYLSLLHTDSPDNFDEPETLANNAIQLVVTLTDGDGDQVSSSIDIGSQIIFEDDGPSITLQSDTAFPRPSMTLDESIGVNPLDPNAHEDDIVGPSLVPGHPTEPFGQRSIASTTIAAMFLVSFGADGPLNGDPDAALSFEITDNNGDAHAGTSTNLFVTGDLANEILLFTNGSVIEGWTGGALGAGTLAFAIGFDANGDLVVQQFAALHHEDPLNPDDSVFLDDLIFITAMATDGDGDIVKVTHSTAIEVEFQDDAPEDFTPEQGYIVNAVGQTSTMNLAFADKVGTDGLGTVVFDITDGQQATDNGNPLTINGEQIYLFGDGTTTLTGSTDPAGLDATKIVFTVVLDPSSDTYQVTVFQGPVSNGIGFSEADIAAGISGGNSLFVAIGANTNDGTPDIFLSSPDGDTINTSQGRIGVGGGQSIDDNETLLIQFLINIDQTNDPGNIDLGGGFFADSRHETTSFSQNVNRVQGNGLASLHVQALLFLGIDPDIVRVVVTDENDDIVIDTTVDDSIETLSVVFNGGTVSIVGMDEGWTYFIETNGPMDAVQVSGFDSDNDTGNNDDDAPFTLGAMTLGGQPFEPFSLEADIVGTDGDGDGVTSTIIVNFLPDNDDNFVGTASDDILNGNGNDNIIAGLAGSDILNGGAGDDIIIGGPGFDTMTGGIGNDTFVWNAGDMDGTTDVNFDAITDWNVGDNILDISALLAGFGFNSGVDTVSDWVDVTDDGTHTTMAVATSADNATNGVYSNLVTLQNIVTDLATLEGNNNIVT